jgi:hypothetical protein
MDDVQNGGSQLRDLHKEVDRELEFDREGKEVAIANDSDFVTYEAALHSLHGAVVELEAHDVERRDLRPGENGEDVTLARGMR